MAVSDYVLEKLYETSKDNINGARIDKILKVGDKIVCSHHIPCMKCSYCKGESYSMCQHFKKTNIIPGGFSEYVYLSEEHLENVAYKVPQNMTNEEISFYEPLSCCIRAIERANLKEESNVLVIGLGSIGNIMGQALKAYGMNVFGCDLMQERIDIATQKGIFAFNSNDIEKSQEYIDIIITKKSTNS